MITPNGPCYGCVTRVLGCHNKCSKYITFKEEVEFIRNERNKHIEYHMYRNNRYWEKLRDKQQGRFGLTKVKINKG